MDNLRAKDKYIAAGAVTESYIVQTVYADVKRKPDGMDESKCSTARSGIRRDAAFKVTCGKYD